MSICDKDPAKHRGSTASVAQFDKLGRILCNWCGLPDTLEPNNERLQSWKQNAERYKEETRQRELEKERQKREFVPQEVMNEWGLIQTRLSAWLYNMTTDVEIVKAQLNSLKEDFMSIHNSIKNNPQELEKWSKFKQLLDMRLA